jgi:hypothetical protein
MESNSPKYAKHNTLKVEEENKEISLNEIGQDDRENPNVISKASMIVVGEAGIF